MDIKPHLIPQKVYAVKPRQSHKLYKLQGQEPTPRVEMEEFLSRVVEAQGSEFAAKLEADLRSRRERIAGRKYA